MSKKSPRIAALLAGLPATGRDPHYVGFFECFNRQLFYEAHDVLEELWLSGGRNSPNYRFHKGLIQLAGAFVHLQKDRLRPAVALFNLADCNLSAYPATHEGLSLSALLLMLHEWRGAVEGGSFVRNPLVMKSAPRIEPPKTGSEAISAPLDPN